MPRSALLPLFLATSLQAASAATLIDDFEGYPTGNIRDTTVSSVWDPNGSSFADIRAESGNQYFAFGWDDAGYRGAHRSVGPGIGASATSTLFFKVRAVDDRIDHAIGLTEVADPGTTSATFSDFRAQIALQADGTASDGAFNLVSGAATLTAGLTTNTWYNLWMVIDNGSDTMDVYLNTGAAAATAGDKLNGSPVAFLNGTTAVLDRFVTSGSDSVNSPGHSVHVDDIHLASGIQLGNPPIPEPSIALVSLLGLGLGLARRCR